MGNWLGCARPSLGNRVVPSVEAFYDQKKQHNRGVFYPNLLTVIEAWAATYKCEPEEGDKASIIVPKDMFQALFPTAHGDHFLVGSVKQRLAGSMQGQGDRTQTSPDGVQDHV